MSLTTKSAATPASKADATNASSLPAEAFLGQWTTSTQQNVLVVQAGTDKPDVLKAILTKPDAPEDSKPLQLLIKMDHQLWRCGNGVLVFESPEEQPSEISWVSWNGIRSTWFREKSWSDMAKALKPEDSTAHQPKAEGKPEDQTKAEGKPEDQPKAEGKPEDQPKAEGKPEDETKAEGKPVPSKTQGVSNNQAANGMKAEHFLGHWKNSHGFEVSVTYMDDSQGLLTATVAKPGGKQELLLKIDTSAGGGGRWRCGNGHLHDHIEYDNKQAKTLTWTFPRFNKWTCLWEIHVSTWERECDGSSSTPSTDEGTEESNGTWWQMTKEAENEQAECAFTAKLMGQSIKKAPRPPQLEKATRATQKNGAQWDSRWVEVTDKTQKAAKGAGKNQWREVDGWKKRSGGHRQKKATQ